MDLFPYPLKIYANVTYSNRYASPPVEASTTVTIADTVCNYQYTDSFSLTSDLFGSNYAYINCPYTLIPEGDLNDIDTEVFPQFANVTDDDGYVFDLAESTITIRVEFTTLGGATWTSSIIKLESVKVGKIAGYEVGTTIWVELGN